MKKLKIAIIGAGPAGSTIARIAAESGCLIDLFDKRDHIGGNCHDQYNKNGTLIHSYGPHYFRTDSMELLDWLSQFTRWQPAQYIVKAMSKGKLIPMPISLSTMTKLTGEIFNKEKFENYLKENTLNISDPQNAEEHCLAQIGPKLYEELFKNYTIKQWGLDPKKLPTSITARIPLRFSFDERYPQEKYQVIPQDGYTAMFENILNHENIKINLGRILDADSMSKMRNDYDVMIYTGPIDHFFNYCFGKLQYRSLRFDWLNFPVPYKQPCVQINYPNDHDYTRTVEIKHVTGQISDQTSICYEFPQDTGEPFYPILSDDNNKRYNEYYKLSEQELNNACPVYFIGRLAEFKYYNMDHVFIKAMELAKKIIASQR